MLDSKIEFKSIRNTIISGLGCKFLSFVVIEASVAFSEVVPEIETPLIILAQILFLLGYVICWISACKYAIYKGYPDYFGLLGFFNIFGLAMLFLLDNKNLGDNPDGKYSLQKFNILSIFIGCLAIAILGLPILVIVSALIGGVDIAKAFDYLDDEDYLTILSIILNIIFSWYIFSRIKKNRINFQQLLGSFKKIDFKFPIGLAIVNYIFAKGINNISLYYLSFVVPQYVENQINTNYVTTPFGWVCYAIAILICAPLIEEILCRGIIMQKLAIEKNATKGLIISAIIFTVIHFRYDVISLFTGGIVLGILYLKTKQLASSIIYHFFYNFIVYIRLFYSNVLNNVEPSTSKTIAEYQQQVSDKFELAILFVALSAPYLIYFIYKNFPRNYSLEKLPYFANQSISNNP